MLIIQKRLFKIDLEKVQSQLLMPFKQILSNSFLNSEEMNGLTRKTEDGIHHKGINVRFFRPCRFKETKIILMKWQSNGWSVLTKNWYGVANKIRLKVDDIVQIWFFRETNGNPGIGLVILELVKKMRFF